MPITPVCSWTQGWVLPERWNLLSQERGYRGLALILMTTSALGLPGWFWGTIIRFILRALLRNP